MTTAGMSESTMVMDPGAAFTLLLSCPDGLPRSRVYVDFGISYDRIPHPDTKLEESINEYGGHTLHHADGADNKSSVCLHLGLTDYRTFVGTNLSPLWENFLVPSKDDSICCQHSASPLGNGAIVKTADKRVLVLQRSLNVGEFPGYFVFPGGHSEPEEVGVLFHQMNKNSTEHEALNDRVSQEMFEGIVREVVEEIGVPAESLSDPIFIGISRRNLNVRPTAFFFVNCSLKSDEIQQLYSRAQDGYESTQLFDVSMEELLKMSERMPGCHRGGYALYELMMKANHGDL
ncbi:nudix hydrolase 9 isoform X2 [Dendrobium catenatum]|uniref:nudix hydrolase 9 isoform X2 n=1 Tax=Dendrobium catenatum TaxID=906689 RepID=UPI0009F4A307|nr:nudix hydrolase 9 isoform X2 [Dendrobium catenatum]